METYTRCTCCTCCSSRSLFLLSIMCASLSVSYSETDFYSFNVKNSDGSIIPLQSFRGMVSLVVNVASECGYTHDNYEQLVKLQTILQHQGFTVLAFPSNQFGAQEPGSDEAIQEFVREKYHVNFPVFAKIDVLDSGADPVYKWLVEKSKFAPNWNFHKYLINESGEVVNNWSVRTAFTEVVSGVKKVLREKDEGLRHKDL